MAEPYVLRDMIRKCDDDVSRVVHMNVRLLDDPSDGVALAISAAAGAMGIAVGIHMATDGYDCSADEAVDAIIERFRPMAVNAANAILAERSASQPDAQPHSPSSEV